jgi:hypothetical protein
MSSEWTRGPRGDRRAQSERRLVVLGVVTVLVVAVPELRAAAVQLLVGVVTLLVLLGLLGVLALAIARRVARRHPVAELAVGAWAPAAPRAPPATGRGRPELVESRAAV